MWDHHYSSGSGLNNIEHGMGKINLIMQIDNFPQFFRPQDPGKTEEDRTKIKKKVDKVRKSLYIESGTFLILTHMFYVHKGLNDIRMVYNGTSCGFNPDLWAPYFGLPIFQHTLRALIPE